MRDAERSLRASLQEVHLDGVHPPLEGESVFQSVIGEGYARAGLSDARQEVLYLFFGRRPREGPPAYDR